MRSWLAMGIALVLWVGAAASATARPLPPINETRIQVEMTLDCRSLSGKARDYALGHGYCKRSIGQAVPMGEVAGNCGTSWFYIRDTGIREATFRYGFTSNWGVVVSRQLFGYWSSTSGLSGSFSDASLMASTGYSTTRTRVTGYGGVTGWIGGEVTLIWGGRCKLGQPGDYEFIS